MTYQSVHQMKWQPKTLVVIQAELKQLAQKYVPEKDMVSVQNFLEIKSYYPASFSQTDCFFSRAIFTWFRVYWNEPDQTKTEACFFICQECSRIANNGNGIIAATSGETRSRD